MVSFVMMPSEGFELEEFEMLVYGREYDPALAKLAYLLNTFETLATLQITIDQKQEGTPELIQHAYTRLASAITTLLADEKVRLSRKGLEMLCSRHRQLQGIFSISGFGNGDHLSRIVGNCTSRSNWKISLDSPQKMAKFLLGYSLSSNVDIDLAVFLQQIPSLALAVYLGLLSTEVVTDSRSHAMRQRFLNMGPVIEQIPLPDYLVSRLLNVWMLCSYTDGENKHDIKIHLNRMLRKWVESKGIRPPELPVARNRSERPLILVAAEHFDSRHAVFRCFGYALSQLKERFRLVLLVSQENVDDHVMSLFDDVITLSVDESVPAERIAKAVETVRQIQPDMIWYPSIGMLAWTTALATFRLAPIQFATMGHPATTKLPTLDYLVLGSNHLGNADLFTERLVVLPSPFPVVMRPDTVPLKPEIREHPDLLRIAIASSSYKLNVSFMSLLRRLQEKSRRKLEFHFFGVNSVGFRHHLICAEVWKWLPLAKLYPVRPYAEYIDDLKTCDIYLGTFPFGGTNSNIDCMTLGIPGVVYEGLEPHSRLDSRIVRLFGLPEWVITHSEEEYEKAALRLINDDEERLSLSYSLIARDPMEVIAGERLAFGTHFVSTVQFMYEHHEAIQEQGAKIITPDTHN
jgi:hypothetical protein